MSPTPSSVPLRHLPSIDDPPPDPLSSSPVRGASPQPWQKDTVLVAASVAGRSGHVEQHQVGPLGLVDHHLVQLDRRVHPPHVGLVPVETGPAVRRKAWTHQDTVMDLTSALLTKTLSWT